MALSCTPIRARTTCPAARGYRPESVRSGGTSWLAVLVGRGMAKRSRTYWAQTVAGREHARRNALRWQEQRHSAPRCKATAKSTGERCGNPAMKGQKVCCRHGGLSVRGAGWLKPRFPKLDTPAAFARLQRKLQTLERRARLREVRIAAMSPTELERYRAWHAARQPGSAAKRHAAKMPRPERVCLADLAALPSPPPSPEMLELNRQLDAARRRLADLENDGGAAND